MLWMMMRTSLLLCLACFPQVAAYPTGTGACYPGGPSVGGPHLTAGRIITGTLGQGGLSLSVSGRVLSPGQTVYLDLGVAYTITLSSTSSKRFKGHLIRVGGPNTTDFTPGTNSAIAQACIPVDAFGATHYDDDSKSKATATVMFHENSTYVPLDVTAVVSVEDGDVSATQAGGSSEYYFSGFVLKPQQGGGPPTPAPTPAPQPPIRSIICKIFKSLCK